MTQELFISTVLPLRDKCYRFAASILRNGPESEDVAQEVLLKMVEEREAVDAVFDCMKQLPDLQRNILHLREVEEHSYEEIAQALDLSAAQVKVYLHRARKKVRALMDPSHAPNPQTRQSQTND